MAYIGSGPTRFNTADDLTVTDDAEIQGGLTVDTTTLVVDEVNNRVGIGTSSPSEILHINSGTDNDCALFESTDNIAAITLADNAGSVQIRSRDTGEMALHVGGDASVAGTSSSEAVRIDSSGNVGIGTSSPAAPLEVSTSSADYRIQLTHTSGQNKIKSLDGNQSTYRNLYYDAAQHFWQTSGTERMRIDSSGRVTKPYQPAFQISGASTSISAGGEVYDDSGDWDSVLLDVGSNFNTSNGRFTAPVAGNYFLNASQFCVNSTTGTYQGIRINKNGSQYGYTMYGYVQTSNDETVAVSVVMPMAAGDYATVQCFIGNSGTQNGNRILFSGHLIG